MGRPLHEPLVHCIAVGLLLFLIYALVSPAGSGGDMNNIVISRAMVTEIASG